jgi:hypothetical protein
MKRTEKQIYLDFIKELAKERDKYEYRYKHPLPKGWIFADEHPRYGETLNIKL